MNLPLPCPVRQRLRMVLTCRGRRNAETVEGLAAKRLRTGPTPVTNGRSLIRITSHRLARVPSSCRNPLPQRRAEPPCRPRTRSGSFTRTGSCTRTGSFVDSQLVGQCLGTQLVVGGRPGAPARVGGPAAGRRPGDAEIREVGFFPTKYFESLLPGQSRKRPTRRGCPRGRPSLEPARGPPGPRRQKNVSWNGGRGGRFRRTASASLAPCTSSASTAPRRTTSI